MVAGSSTDSGSSVVSAGRNTCEPSENPRGLPGADTAGEEPAVRAREVLIRMLFALELELVLMRWIVLLMLLRPEGQADADAPDLVGDIDNAPPRSEVLIDWEVRLLAVLEWGC